MKNNTVPFYKIHGCGNSFVLVKKSDVSQIDLSKLAIHACSKQFGIGSDGLMVIGELVKDEFHIEMFNPDGSLMGMCGNGIRCVTKFLFLNELIPNEYFLKFQNTSTNEIKISYIIEGRLIECWTSNSGDTVKVNMGALTYDPVRIPIDSKEEAIEKQLSANGHSFIVTAIEIGNPHAIIYEQIEDEKTLSAIENHPFFPRRTNVECVTVVSENKIKVSMWERGAGVTYACGTGGCAAAVASERLGKVKLPVDVEFIGGTVNISWNEDKTKVYLTGPTKVVCQGELRF